MKAYQKWLGWLVILLLSAHFSNASHIRGGEITIERLSCQGLTVRITLTAYLNLVSGVEFGEGWLNFSDGSDPVKPREGMILIEESDLGNGYGRIRFQIEHTFISTGNFAISYSEPNRNDGIVNMDNSFETPFYIETLIFLNESECCNSFPVLLIPPIDDACTGVAFFHNPGAWDADGDSLSYELTIPRQAEDKEVDNYRFPDQFGGMTEQGNDPVVFSVDPKTGDILWDAPELTGQYNIAFIIKEWRKINNQAVLLSETTRDMQVNVLECNNHRPELTIPEDVCIEAGTTLTELITGSDPDGDSTNVELFGGPFELDGSPAEFINGEFSWQTLCDHASDQPYQINVRISEDGENSPGLSTIKSWKIKVLPPAPKGIDLTILPGRRIQLDWDPYFCTNAEAIQIWRRVDHYAFSNECTTGIPDYAGYKLIAELGANVNTFTDDNNGNFLDFGALSCYRLIAVFPTCGVSESKASDEVCGLIEAEAPVITQVTVEKTHQENGEIFLRWTRPFEINEGSFPPPYFYDLYRTDSIDGNDFQLIASDLTETDTAFTDTSINTLELGYSYYVELKDANKIPLITSSSASSVYLSAEPLPGEIRISWEAHVPWSNNTQSYPMHYIYRDHVTSNPKEMVLIDSINVNQKGFRYVDMGQSKGEELNENYVYCYFISTRGSYGNPRIGSPLINDSQILCGQTEDHSAPCAPELALVQTDCEVFMASLTSCSGNDSDFENELSWTFSTEDACLIEDLENYNIYYSHDGSEPFTLIASLEDTEFIHQNLESLAGCYYVTALDRSGNESIPSQVACNDNCPGYALPNVFTPNGDGHNDFFKALNGEDNPDLDPEACPLFVKHVLFRVFNRYGKEVYAFDSGGENGILIGWNGVSEGGKELSSGVYYYTAEVLYDVIDQEKQIETLKGWMQLLK